MAGRKRDILCAKKRTFEDWGIPWDKTIEAKWKTEVAARPDADPEVILDRLTHDLIARPLESL